MSLSVRFKSVLKRKKRLYYDGLRHRNQSKVEPTAIFEEVEWLSYHIPKTAGTSLRAAYEQIFTDNQLTVCYRDSYAREMSNGLPVWCSSDTRIIHGHFRVNSNHSIIYPNAKKIVWLRNPVNRAWSMVNHWLRYGNFPASAGRLTAKNPELLEDTEQLFIALLAIPELRNQFETYQHFIGGYSPCEFGFIGNSDNFSSELVRLGQLLGRPMIEQRLNSAPQGLTLKKYVVDAFEQAYPGEIKLHKEFIGN